MKARAGRGLVPRVRYNICRCCYKLDADAALNHADANEHFVVVSSGDSEQKKILVRLTRPLHHIAKAAVSGCRVCAMVLKMLVFFDVIPKTGSIPDITLLVPVGIGSPQVEFMRSGIETVIQLYTVGVEAKPWFQVPALPEICRDNTSEESMSFMRSCLKACLESHSLCKQREGKDEGCKYPARLLDLGLGSDDRIELVDTEKLETMVYTALSYCWGEKALPMTTVDNLASRQQGIDLATLPLAFIDAIELTRRLGFRFIWIDALCIIQDSQGDWETESAKMAAIYGSAQLTIAATSSASAANRFLNGTRPVSRQGESGDNDDYEDYEYEMRVFSERVEDEKGDPVTLKARVIPQSGIHWKWRHSSEDRRPTEALLRRGWTLQEQLLSTRFLSISSTELQWTCREAQYCECSSGLNRHRQFGSTPIALLADAGDLYRFWHKVVENYSKRALTNPGDQLPAISGIADVVQQKTASRYVAGLWADNIDLELLWRRSDALVKGTSGSNNLQVPSFSWASVHGEVDYYCFQNGKRPYRARSSVVEMETTVQSLQAPLAGVTGGKLTIRGPLVSGVIEKSTTTGWTLVKAGEISLGFIADVLLEELTMTEPTGQLTHSVCRWTKGRIAPPISAGEKLPPLQDEAGLSEPGDASAASATGHLPRPGARCWVLRLGTYARDPVQGDYKEEELLILGRSPDNPLLYQRIGLVSNSIPTAEQAVQGAVMTTIALT